MKPRFKAISTFVGLLLVLPMVASADGHRSELGLLAPGTDYRSHDNDNYTRARAMMFTEALDPSQGVAFAQACADTSSRAYAKQAQDARYGRVYTGVGQATCWWSTGRSTERYFDYSPQRINFFYRTGAKLQGHIWTPDPEVFPAPRPGVVITTGSINASDQMYWWAARALVDAGYVVFTYDVQGQGQSETTGHSGTTPVVPTTSGVPFQQSANFFDGTIDAIRFFLSKPSAEYRPQGWDEARTETVKSWSAGPPGEQIAWSNPAWSLLDQAAPRIGIAGHSLGGSAVAEVQACSDESTSALPAVCGGQRYPIKAVTLWDGGSPAGARIPVMVQSADSGYFLFPTLSSSPNADWPESGMAAFRTARSNGIDIYKYNVRAGTHIEWSQTPYTSATTYGWHMNAYYTVSWMDRYVNTDLATQRSAYQRLKWGPKRDPKFCACSASYMAARHKSAMYIHEPFDPQNPDAVLEELDFEDLRAYAGLTPIPNTFAGVTNDYWAAVNADSWGSALFVEPSGPDQEPPWGD